MAKTHKKKGKRKTSVSTPPVFTGQGAIVPISPPQEATAPRGKIRQVGARLFDSAFESALSNIWLIVGGFLWSAAVTVFIAAYLFFRAPESAWVYSLLKYALVYMGGFVTFAFLLVVFALLGIRRRGKQAAKKLRASKYISTVKGPLDYRAELSPAIKTFQHVLTEMGRETTKVGERTGKMIRMTQVLAFSPYLVRRSASKGAAALNKHCERIEDAGERLIEATDALLEVSEGCLKFAPDASQGNKQPLVAVQESLVVMDESADQVIQTQKTLRESAQSAYGQVSMDVHTSLNWLIATAEQNIRILENFRTKIALTLVPMLEKKLSS